jgi:hypothetical protein
MSLSDIGALNHKQAGLLEFHEWTIEKLAMATIKELVKYAGIGEITARRAIAEASAILNEQGLEAAEALAEEHYYQKAPLAKILTDWEEGGLPAKAVALSSAASLAVMKGIDEPLALRLISKAQDVVNKRGLYQSRIATPRGGVRQTNAAFDEKWLSGKVVPPAMSIRVRRNFERARREYRANND